MYRFSNLNLGKIRKSIFTYKYSNHMSKQYLNTENFTQTMGAYSHWLKLASWDSEMIFVTEQIAIDNVISL